LDQRWRIHKARFFSIFSEVQVRNDIATMMKERASKRVTAAAVKLASTGDDGSIARTPQAKVSFSPNQ